MYAEKCQEDSRRLLKIFTNLDVNIINLDQAKSTKEAKAFKALGEKLFTFLGEVLDFQGKLKISGHWDFFHSCHNSKPIKTK